MESDPAPALTPQPSRRTELHWPQWLLITGLLIGPAILALFGAMARVEVLAIASPLLGGGIGGIYCGTLLARRFGKTTGSKVLLGILFSAGLVCLSLGVGFFGCVLGGFKWVGLG